MLPVVVRSKNPSDIRHHHLSFCRITLDELVVTESDNSARYLSSTSLIQLRTLYISSFHAFLFGSRSITNDLYLNLLPSLILYPSPPSPSPLPSPPSIKHCVGIRKERTGK
ncbi:hypothetical protein E3N88_34509 [Mikania micrantha]|uniref:Uncharacterized protein n=1 Tax=Mikania micrantha TaxID=192012 RepID=A0A5N6LYB8_9ASTR|nr:hypothetical protein E3N88_34509 [Mikania micrantha]